MQCAQLRLTLVFGTAAPNDLAVLPLMMAMGVPENNANNDSNSGYQAARGGGDYSWGPVPSDWDSNGAELYPMAHNETKRRRRAEGGPVERRHPYYTAPIEPKESAIQKIHATMRAWLQLIFWKRCQPQRD